MISRVSAAKPRIADYPFTTLIPNLGLVRLGDERAMVVADIPGLIAGAHQGAGLGHRFLRHIERTRVLVYLVDDRHALEGQPGTPLADLEVLRAELAAFQPALARRPAVVALNKCDLLTPERREELQGALEQAAPGPVVLVSAVTGDGLKALLEAAWTVLRQTDEPPPAEVPQTP